jgi:CBS domain containing-hemolysin-like protein
LLAGKGRRTEPLGMTLEKDLLHQMLDGEAPNPIALIREPLVVHESAPILKVLELFKKAPARMVTIIDEYGTLQGIVTQTDLLEAIAGQLPETEGEEPEIIEREDGSLLIDGMMPVQDALQRLGVRLKSAKGDFHTIAGLAVSQLGHLPQAGEHFDLEGWRFEIVDMDGRRIDKLLASRMKVPPQIP